MLKFIFYFALLSLIISLTSCNQNNPIGPNSNEQSVNIKYTSIYDWQFIHFDGGSGIEYSIYATDTNQVFITSYIATYFYDGYNFRIIYSNSLEFQAETIAGTNENNIYLGGMGSNGIKTHAKLKKWDGNSVYEINIPDDTSSLVTYLLVKSENDIWILTDSKYVYHYDGISNMKRYFIPIGGEFFPDKIFSDLNGKIFLFGKKYTEIGELIYVLQFNNENFEVIMSDFIDSSTELQNIAVSINNDFLRSGKNFIHYFEPTGWQEVIGKIDFGAYNFAGNSRSDFICNGNKLGYFQIYFYKNGQWYIDTNYTPPNQRIFTGIKSMIMIKNYCFAIYDPPSSDYLIIGKPNNASKIYESERGYK